MTASIVRIVSVGLTGAILCACGGGGSAVPSSPRSTSKKFAQATFTIKWTNTTATAAMRRKDTISPSAQSIAVLINGISNTIANRTGGSTQSIVLNAPVGTDTFAFNVYDQLNAQGHLLGAAAVTQQIVDGAANVVNAAIQAVCSATNVGFTGNDLSAFATLSEPGRAQTVTSIVVAGQASANLVIAPEDVDGDVIISGTGGAIDYSISGSATVTPIDGETLSLKPLTGPRATTPDTLTVSAPGCPSATVGVEHSPAIYTQHDGNEVTVQDWYGEHSAPLTITTGDTLIGFDPVSQKVIAYNSSTGKVNAYTVGLTSSTTLYTITPGSTVTWSNNLHSIIGFRPAAGALPAQFYTYASGAIQTYSLSPLGNVTLLAASTLSSNASLIAFTSTNTFYDFASETVPSLNGIFQVGTPSYNAFAINGATAEVYGFFASGSSYVSVWPVSIFNTPTTGNLGFTDFATLAGVDTDANIIYAIVDGNLEASTPAGTPLNIPANAYNSATAMVVISTNEQ